MVLSNNKFCILHTPAGLSIPVTDITDAIQINEHEGIRASADDFSFNVMAKTKYEGFFNDGDRIKIYLSTGNTTPALIMDGLIKEIKLNISLDKEIWQISGQNILEILLNAPIPTSYSKTGSFNTSAKAIKNIVSQVKGLNKNARYTSIVNINAELKSLNGYIDDTTNTLQNFVSDYGRTQTSAFQLIEELSTWKWTGLDLSKGSYIFYLDTDNNFHWEPRSNTVALNPLTNLPTITKGDFLEAKIEKTLFDVINYVIINCGKDFNGNNITTYVYQPTYLVKGIKGKFFVNETLANNRKKVPFSSNKPWGETDKFTGSSDNQTFRNNVKIDGKAYGQSILQVFGAPRFQASITVKGTTAFIKGNLYTISVKGIFRDLNDSVIDQLNLRLREVTHSFNSKGWTTSLLFQQDEISITGAMI